MATSGTVTWRPDVAEVITEAYERCGYTPAALTARDMKSARMSLNLMFSEWAVRGINYWAITEVSQALVSGTSTYTLPVGTVDMLTPVVRRSGVDTPLTRMALSGYQELSDKTTPGLPVNFFLDRQYTPKIILWPVPDNSTDTIEYWQLSQLEDVTASAQDVDAPHRWQEALCSGLAAKLGVKKITEDAVKRLELKTDGEIAFGLASGDERERATLRIVPTPVII